MDFPLPMQEREAPIVYDQWLVRGSSSAGCLDPTVKSSPAGVVDLMVVDHIPLEEEVHHHTGRKAVVVVDRTSSAVAADLGSTVVGHTEAVEGKDLKACSSWDRLLIALNRTRQLLLRMDDYKIAWKVPTFGVFVFLLLLILILVIIVVQKFLDFILEFLEKGSHRDGSSGAAFTWNGMRRWESEVQKEKSHLELWKALVTF